MVRDSCGVALFGFLAFERFSGSLYNVFLEVTFRGEKQRCQFCGLVAKSLFINFLGRKSRYQAIDRVRYDHVGDTGNMYR